MFKKGDKVVIKQGKILTRGDGAFHAFVRKCQKGNKELIIKETQEVYPYLSIEFEMWVFLPEDLKLSRPVSLENI